MRKRTVVLVLALLILCLAPMQMFAVQANQAANLEIGPLWVNIVRFSNFFDISSNGLAQIDTSLLARSNINGVVINASIQRYANGNWQTIKSWTNTSNGYIGDLTENWNVVSGHYYRLVSNGTVYQNGVLVEQTSYTGPAYWY
ncbi:MAG: hypothetical protein GX207_11060 [Peptococcaceae bacterium]|nr:hypothetical protein [Peptococcaceae bacterium]